MAAAFDNLTITTDFSLRLCAALRQHGIEVGTQQSIACLRAVVLFGTVEEDELKCIYRTTLINRKQDFWQLDSLYNQLIRDYTLPGQAEPEPRHEDDEPVLVRRRFYSEDKAALDSDRDATRTEGYSVQEVDHHKDFRLLPKQDVSEALAELRRATKKHAWIRRRKLQNARRPSRIDLRRTVRDSVKHDGEIIRWRYRRRRPTHSRYIVVSDVSGSMEIYSIFLLNLFHLLNSYRRLQMESFVFSTRLERLTQQFRTRDFGTMLKEVTGRFSGWSGGTKIGAAIEKLNHAYGALITPKTTVIIMSDGWDTGDMALLDREMAFLHRRAKSIVWINPLKAAPDYEPLAIGMATALPYCDHFLTGHSIHSLIEFATMLCDPTRLPPTGKRWLTAAERLRLGA